MRVDIRGAAGDAGSVVLRASGSEVEFPGFLAAYGTAARTRVVGPAPGRNLDEDDTEESIGASSIKTEMPAAALAGLTKGEELMVEAVNPVQHFTRPPPRFTESSLVKALEEHGIGRPSTYASILKVLQVRRLCLYKAVS